MSEEEYIRKTQESLGAIIKKPPLTDKLLAKPPFRFLHDVLMAVIKTTGFMDGLYSAAELDSQQVNDKDKKIAFLQKAIDLLQLINGEPLSVKPGKVVAGQEPDKTNEFLQALASAIKKQPNSKEFVQRVLNGEKGGESGSAGSNKENKKSSSSRSSSKEKTSAKEDTKAEKSSSKQESSSKDKTKTRSSSKESKDRDSSSAKTSKRDGSADRNSKSKEKEKEKEDGRIASKSRDKKSADSGDEKRKDKKSDEKKSADGKKAAEKEKKSSKSRDDSSEKKEKNNSNTTNDDEKIDKLKVDKEKEKKRKSKKKEDNDVVDDNHLLTTSTNGVDEPKLKKEKSKIEVNKKTSDDELAPADVEPLSPKAAVSKGRRGSFSAKEGGGARTVSAVEGRKESAPLDDNGVLVKPGLVRQTRSARPATATSTTARPGTAAGGPASIKQEPSGLKRKEINIDDKKITRGESFNQDQTTTGKVITESHNGVDEDDNFIVDDSGPSAIDNLLNDQLDNELSGEIDERDDHGQLVRKILETKKGLENQIKVDGKSSVDKTVIIYDAKEREKAKQESQKLQELVQHLTRNSHPLGKIVDFLQEDVDSMLKELQQWRQEYKTNMDNVRQELGSNSGHLEPLKTKLSELDQQINEQLDAITAIRGRMLANEDKIHKIFSSMAKK